MDPIVIIGASDQAKVIIDIVQREDQYTIVGLLDARRKVGDELFGYRVLGADDDLPELMQARGLAGAIIAIGDNFVRARVAARIRERCPGLPFVCAVHPKAAVATDVAIGEGTVIMAGVCVNPCSSIGRFCILNTNSSLDHDSAMADFSSLAPGAVTGGNCRIGEYSAISIGATLINGVQVGEHSVVGAASLVTRSIDSFVLAYGVPAKTIRIRQAGDKYL